DRRFVAPDGGDRDLRTALELRVISRELQNISSFSIQYDRALGIVGISEYSWRGTAYLRPGGSQLPSHRLAVIRHGALQRESVGERDRLVGACGNYWRKIWQSNLRGCRRAQRSIGVGNRITPCRCRSR